VLINKPELSSLDDIISLFLLLTVILLIGGIALFFWMLKRGRLRIVPGFSGEQRKSSTMLSQSERSRASASEGEAKTYFPMSAQKGSQVAQRSLLSDDPLKNSQWLELVKECVTLYDELDALLPDLDPARQEMAKHVQSRLEEILVRSSVDVIAHDQFFDIRRHKLAVPGPAVAPMTPITETVSLGFAVKQLVIRPAQVRVAPTEEG